MIQWKMGWTGWIAAGVAWAAAGAHAQMRITEYMYQGTGPEEFVEFTNVGGTPIDMTGWSYDDDSRLPGTISLSAYGVVAPGESVILTETSEAAFRASYGLALSVKIIGLNTANLGRNDEINLYDNSNALVDRLTYGDQTLPGSIRTQNISGWPCAAALGANDAYGWVLSILSDVQGSILSANFNVANPGQFTLFNCPPAPTGACCEAGLCNQRTQAQCTGLGIYQGDSTNCGSVSCPSPTGALVRITEYMYGGTGLEFIEIRNFSASPVNMTGWSYSDETRIPGHVSLSAFGTLAPGETAILAEANAADFRVDWGLPPSQKVIGGNTVNIGGADEINIYDLSGALVDRLTYGTIACGVDADGRSAWPCSSAVGTNSILEWRESFPGDAQGSITSLVGDIGNPGAYISVSCMSGSCCINGNCSEQGQGACLSAGGVYLGDGTNCVNDPCLPASNAEVRLTEYMYQGANGEFFEITNLGSNPVNLAGWSFGDTCSPVGAFDLSSLGVLAAGESAVITDRSASSFRTAWNLSLMVKVHTLPSSELGRNDQINIYDAGGALVDRLVYGDDTFPGTIRTLNKSGWPVSSVLGQNNIQGWRLSEVGDPQGSYLSSGGDTGSPGSYVAFVPSLSIVGLMALALMLVAAGVVIIPRRTRTV